MSARSASRDSTVPWLLTRRGRHPDPADDPAHLVVGQRGQDRLAHPGVVQVGPPAHLGEHPHRVRRRLLGDVDDLIPVHQRHVGGLAELPDQLLQLGLGDAAQLSAGPLSQRDQAGAEGVPAGRELACVAEQHAGPQQPVDGRHRQLGGAGEIAQRRLTAGVGDDLQELEDPLDRLDGSRTRLGGLADGHPLVSPSLPSRWLPPYRRVHPMWPRNSCAGLLDRGHISP